ncbi:MAG TPA: Stp1/IreP family PP2C-type Ser/Thr phosphatase [Ktedonobacterales bacterium]|nr:Stp1/IreP family PP2C-type Ser/Thr phosphatase [Ktedonobacterales bacterium]
MAKKLRLAVAELTDVGRRRERNQDNVSHKVPEDERALDDKGALFVVCDGMGGHAAGEVASEMAVASLLEAYYAGEDADIITAVANAIKQANQSVFQYASEHPEMKGMGTTCVALVIHGGRAYFVNIGDSRGYLVRNGAMRQITLDHSWVAEQVRAGLLTEEQARTHAHRNVITRSVGTQANVSADLFIETLRDGDRVLLCSDGLYGYVDEEFIEREMATHDEPQLGAQHLIDMANENGGPDNITAMIVHLLEVPEVTGEVKLPPSLEGEEQVITRPMVAVQASAKLPAASAEKSGSKSGRAARKQRPAGVRAAAIVVRLLAVAAVLCLAFGGWDFAAGPYAHTRAAASKLRADVASLKQVAQGVSSQQDPTQALASLGSARNRIVSDLNNANLDGQTAATGRDALANDLTPAVRTAIQNYDHAALVSPVNIATAQVYDLACAVSGQTVPVAFTSVTQLTALAPIAPGASGSQTLFAVNGGQLFQIQAPVDGAGAASFGNATCGAVNLPGFASVAGIAAEGTTLYALALQPNGASQVVSIQTSGFNKDGTGNVKIQPDLAPATPAGATPQLVAVEGQTTFVSYKNADSSGGVLIYSGPTPKAPIKTLSLSAPAAALVATGGLAYALMPDGTLAQLSATASVAPLPLQSLKPIPPELIDTYLGSNPVPVASGGVSAVSSNATLIADPSYKQQVLVADGSNNRVLRFNVGSGGTATLATQYVYSAPLTGLTQVALTSSAGTFSVYGWNGAQLVAFSGSETAAGL